MKYLLMNGTPGCLPDHRELHDTREDAIEGAKFLFDDIPAEDFSDMVNDLTELDIHYFTDEAAAGAGYVEIIPISDEQAKTDGWIDEEGEYIDE